MKKTYILFSIVILSSLLTIMMVFIIDSFGWFENGKEALLTNDENCLVMSSSNLEISLDGVNFYNDLNLDITDSLADVTSDGYNFYYPRELNSNDDVNMDDYDNLILLDSSSTDFKNYVKEIDLTFKATEKLDVYLSASSFIEGREDLTGNNITRLSPFAITSNFSSDAISGAIRVAIFEYVDEYLILSTKSREYKLLVSAGYEITDYEEVKNQGIFYTSDGLTKIVSFFTDEDLADVIKVRSNTLELKELWIPNDRYQINIAGGSGTFNEFGTRETFRGNANTNYGYLYKTNGVIVAKAYDASDYAKFITVGSNHLSLVNQISSYINEAKRIIWGSPYDIIYYLKDGRITECRFNVFVDDVSKLEVEERITYEYDKNGYLIKQIGPKYDYTEEDTKPEITVYEWRDGNIQKIIRTNDEWVEETTFSYTSFANTIPELSHGFIDNYLGWQGYFGKRCKNLPASEAISYPNDFDNLYNPITYNYEYTIEDGLVTKVTVKWDSSTLVHELEWY